MNSEPVGDAQFYSDIFTVGEMELENNLTYCKDCITLLMIYIVV